MEPEAKDNRPWYHPDRLNEDIRDLKEIQRYLEEKQKKQTPAERKEEERIAESRNKHRPWYSYPDNGSHYLSYQ
jgi:hypothetical protein